MQSSEEAHHDPNEGPISGGEIKKASNDNINPLIIFSPFCNDGSNFDFNWRSFHNENQTITSNQSSSGKDSPFSSSLSFCSYTSGHTNGVKRSAPSEDDGNEEPSNLCGTLCASVETGAQVCVGPKDSPSGVAPFIVGPPPPLFRSTPFCISRHEEREQKEEIQHTFLSRGFNDIYQLEDVATNGNKEGGCDDLLSTHATSTSMLRRSLRLEPISTISPKTGDIGFLRCFLLQKEREMASAALGLPCSRVDYLFLGQANSSFCDPCLSWHKGNSMSFPCAGLDQDASADSNENLQFRTESHSFKFTRSTASSPEIYGDDEWEGCGGIAPNTSPFAPPGTAWNLQQREQDDDGTAQIQLPHALSPNDDRQILVAGITEKLGRNVMTDNESFLSGLEPFRGDEPPHEEDEDQGDDDNCKGTVGAVNTDDSKFISYADISPRDVLFGRGGFTIHHKGNVYYRKLVSRQVHSYMNKEKRKHKTSLSEDVVRAVIAGGGRFLKKCSNKRDTSIKTASLERDVSNENANYVSKEEEHHDTMTNNKKNAKDDRSWMVLNPRQARRKVSQRFREEAADLEDAGLHSWWKQEKKTSKKNSGHLHKI